MPKTKVIEAFKVKKAFTIGNKTFEIIHGVNFSIESGDFVIIFGPSGCGKSTLLYLASGLEEPTEGKVLVRKQDISKFNSDQKAQFRQTKTGFIFQQFNLLRTMSVQENVALPLIAAGKPRRQALKRAANILHIFGLSKHLNKVPTELSGGQQQKVSMARALAANPWILICDEPTGNLDSKSANEVIEIFYHLNRKSKRTILMVTHNPDYLKYANKTFRMKDGLIEKVEINRRRPKLGKVADFKLSEKALQQT